MRQYEVAEVIGGELQFEAVAGQQAGRRTHDAGIVDLDVDRAAVGKEAVRELRDRIE